MSHIPRLGNVSQAIRYQLKYYNGEGFPEDETMGDELPLASRILRVALDFDDQVFRGVEASQAYVAIREGDDRYDPQVTKALGEVIKHLPNRVVKQIPFADLRPGHVLAENIEDENGTILMRKDQEVSDSALVRLQAFARQRKLQTDVSVFSIETPAQVEAMATAS